MSSAALPETMLGVADQAQKGQYNLHSKEQSDIQRGSSMDALSDYSSQYTTTLPFALGAASSIPYDQRTHLSSSLLESSKAGFKVNRASHEEEEEEGEVVNGDSRQLDDSDGQGILSTNVPITPAALAGHYLVRWPTIASVAVTLYDLLLRLVMTSYYIVGLDSFTSPDQYLKAKALKQSRRYVESCSAKYDAALEAGELRVVTKPEFSEEDFLFARDIFLNKHHKTLALYLSWRWFVQLLQTCSAPGACHLSTITEVSTGKIVALFVEFRQNGFHHFITAMVDHDASTKYGIYVAKYRQLLASCISGSVPLLRLGPTCDDLKIGLGAVPLPLFVVGSCVWAKIEGRCSIICFGIFTSVSLFLYMAMTQWHLDASSVGSLTLPELLVLWTTCMACVKFLPLVSIGLKKILSNPRKYLLQTSFYAQGVIPGAVAAIIIIATWRGVNPLLICDGLCMFVLQGELIGRLGCHFYGCCFGMPANDGSVKSYNRFSVVYFHKNSSVARLRPEYLLRPLLPTQLMQTLYATLGQILVASYVAHCRKQAALENNGEPILRVGTVCVIALSIYSVGRLLFFAIREDENFKSNKSYTTAYMALGTLAGCAGVLCYSLLAAPASPIGLPITSIAGSQVQAHWLNYLILASVISIVNFIVQGLHHHDKVGVFPEIRALMGLSPPSPFFPSPTSANDEGMATESNAVVGNKGREKKKLRARQVFSTWSEGAAANNAQS